MSFAYLPVSIETEYKRCRVAYNFSVLVIRKLNNSTSVAYHLEITAEKDNKIQQIIFIILSDNLPRFSCAVYMCDNLMNAKPKVLVQRSHTGAVVPLSHFTFLCDDI